MLKTDWKPLNGWLMLIPIKLPDRTEGGVILPESYTVKAGSGLCIKAGHDLDNDLVGDEVYFPKHEEYQILDSETEEIFYVVPRDRIILHRKGRKQPDFLIVKDTQGTSSVKPFIKSK